MASTPNRRTFLQAAGATASTFMILKAGSARTYAANEKLNIASIGAGGRAAGDIQAVASENIVALCDVDQNRAARMFNQFPQAKQFKDYRVMLQELESQIDAVIVGTPDHHHFPASMAAIRLGKHVYCEKPLTHSVWEARELTAAARAAGVATQMGNQAQAAEETRVVQEFVMDNAIGQIREAHVWTDRPLRGLSDVYWPQGVSRPTEQPAVPDSLAWDLWLGPAPERPYHPDYAPFKWRGWWDFGTGALGDIACHYFDPVFRALQLGAPSTVEASSTQVNDETYPLGSMITFHFPARGDKAALKLVWYDGGLRPPRPKAIQEGDVMGPNGILLVGEDDAVLMSDWTRWTMYPEQRAKDYGAPPKKLERSPGHHVEWIAACKGGAAAGSNFDVAGPMTEAILLGNVALRSQMREPLTRAQLEWDAEKLTFTNNPAANQFLRREYRDGWV
ncbi:Gfo/Idh/MocA family protein [Roseimaritima ulvae]|uniref:1,5-anhydro-D-fructose reductase n=1 Tax=Roseimaritima ulvae TaxID=980254 RepID=A0A5B9QUC5_9BACT|nr:Gfo/Idh/MocA family oxidoreductase [Roseimaritima ulvae]QEG42604.1 1,5-anhydro-D-fructose reductase [Roseimaritima ulvae]